MLDGDVSVACRPTLGGTIGASGKQSWILYFVHDLTLRLHDEWCCRHTFQRALYFLC